MVIRLVADADSVIAGEHDDAAWLGGQLPNHSELFGEVRPSQLHVAVDTQVLCYLHMSPENTGEAATRVDGPQGGWPTLTLRIDTY